MSSLKILKILTVFAHTISYQKWQHLWPDSIIFLRTDRDILLYLQSLKLGKLSTFWNKLDWLIPFTWSLFFKIMYDLNER